jgi:hypothetical protein
MKILNLESEIHLSEYRKKVFVFITLFIIILSTYSNTFNASWHFDDEPNITDNSNLHLKELSWQNIKGTFFANAFEPGKLYRPAACLSFALNYYSGKDNVFGYHIVNISIHFLAAFFLFLLIYHTLHLPLLKARYGPNSYFIALLATTLWTINPIQTQAITYIVQRMAGMAGMFYIMSMFFYLKVRATETGGKKLLLLILCFFSFTMALGSKENAVILPLSLFLYEILLLQEITGQNLRRNLRLFFIVTGAILILGFTYIYIQGGNILSFLEGYENRPFTLVQRLLTEPRIIIFYISLLLYPVSTRLNLAHSIEISSSLFHPLSTLFSIIAIFVAISFAIHIAKKRPLISFCILFFFLNHAIESTILPLELIFEHRNYIPSMLLFVPIAIGLINAISYFSYKRSMQVIITLSIILVIIGLGHSTFMRNFTWRNEESLWIDCTDKYPDLHRPQHNLAKYYDDINNDKKAIAEYEKALGLKLINIKDEKAITNYNLGVIYLLRK